MHWIQHDKDKVTRGDGTVPQGDLFFVDEVGSHAVVDGVFYIDGAKAVKGLYKHVMKDGSAVEFDVPKKGEKATRTDKQRGGVDVG